MKKLLLFNLLVLLSAVSAFPQTAKNFLKLENGVAAHKEIDAIYRRFGEAYAALDAEKVTNLYAADAAYLPPGSEILKGRQQIRPTFQTFFDQVKKEGRTMSISFRIFQRKIEKNLGYDVGIYAITQFKDGKILGSGEGKFIVVAVKEKDGKWRFQVDGYNNLKPENNQEGVRDLKLDKQTVYMICPFSHNSCPEDELNVKIKVLSQDAKKDNLQYYYTVSGGQITGQGANVIWNLSKVERPGNYTITAGVGISDKIIGKTITKTIELKECPVCDAPCECPTINVTSSEKTVSKGETVEFTADINGGSQDSPTFNWTVENGIIIEGQGTTKIKVRALSGEKVTAIVDVGNLCAVCPTTDSGSVKIAS